MLWGGWGERKREHAGNDGLYHIMCGSQAGFAALWVWPNQPTIWMFFNAVVKIIV